MIIARIVYWLLYLASMCFLALGVSIWFNLIFGPDQGLGGVGSAIAVMIILVLMIVLMIADVFIGRWIKKKTGDKIYYRISSATLILFLLLPIIESIVRKMI